MVMTIFSIKNEKVRKKWMTVLTSSKVSNDDSLADLVTFLSIGQGVKTPHFGICRYLCLFYYVN